MDTRAPRLAKLFIDMLTKIDPDGAPPPEEMKDIETQAVFVAAAAVQAFDILMEKNAAQPVPKEG